MAVTIDDLRAGEESVLFAVYAVVRGEELGMHAWEPRLRDQILRLQFDAQRGGYRGRFPGMVESLIRRDAQPIGWLMVDRTGAALRCLDIAVVSAERGRGIGTQVLRALQQEAAAAGRSIALEVLGTNTGALAFYTRLGFRAVTAGEPHVRLEWRGDPRPGPPATGSVASDPGVFRPHVGTTFTVTPGDAALQLAEVSEMQAGGGMLQFSIFFHGPADRLLPQGTYTLRHDALGPLALFIVPIMGSNEDRIIYEACLSRSTRPDAATASPP
jgi:ribosomal protein S18 acetylase RimI-like enzyme